MVRLLGAFKVLTVLTVLVDVGLAEAVVVLLGAALVGTGEGEFCVIVVTVLVLALGDVFA